jgi:hypothetical protein
MLNAGLVNGGRFQFFPAAKCVIFCVFAEAVINHNGAQPASSLKPTLSK